MCHYVEPIPMELSLIHRRLPARIKASWLGKVVCIPDQEIMKLISPRHKAPTTTNPSLGINNALVSMFEQSKVDPDDVASVTIGTTVRGSSVCSKHSTRDLNSQVFRTIACSQVRYIGRSSQSIKLGSSRRAIGLIGPVACE